MLTVYSLQSIPFPEKHYIGSTEDLTNRLAKHNAGKCLHTSKFKPRRLLVSFQFSDETKARAFERYLKNRIGPGLCKETLLKISPSDYK